jgi:type II secretory pathway pseudopilin PulG
VMIIILALIAILLPVVGKVRTSAQNADVQSQIKVIGDAIQVYFQDFHAYPGPAPNMAINNNTINTGDPDVIYERVNGSIGNTMNANLTMSENLYLALCGGLDRDTSTAPPRIVFDPALAGKGAHGVGLSPKKYKTYLDVKPAERTEGLYKDGIISGIDDTIIPEILDRYPSPLPILYLRARSGANPPVGGGYNAVYNPIITNQQNVPDASTPRPGQYDISQIIAYTKSYDISGGQTGIGEGKKVPKYYRNAGVPMSTQPPHPLHGLNEVNFGSVLGPPGPNYYYPYDSYAYFKHPTLPNTARSKDSFILISAGVDRIYGTKDDITSFGAIEE